MSEEETDDREWYLTDGVIDLNKIATTAEYMARTGEGTDNIVYLIEKPWKYGDMYKEAMEAEAAS